jgi:tRNA/tmRNA/rRNA uracil-C5-methylase (TrmA/RlmC/RlmD family)
LKADDLITVRCEKIAHGGFVVARHEGIVIFVRLALPGELVKIKILKSAPGKRAWIAEAIEILESNQHRVTPRCKYFKPAGCGGCDFQHVDIDYQLILKKEILIEQMNRLAGILTLPEITTHQLSPKDFEWRNKIRLTANKEGQLGFRKFRSNDVIPISRCEIALSEINLELTNSKDQFFDSEIEIISSENETLVLPKNPDKKITSKVGDIEYVHYASGFWQSHTKAAEKLCALLLEKTQINHSCLDLYAGVAVFGKLLLQNEKIKTLISVELDKKASECAVENLSDFSSAKAVQADADKFIFQSQQTFDLIVLDPPRSGLGQKSSEKLALMAKKQIIYIACDPASLARDTKVLTSMGWRLSQLDLVDAFPQSHHLETVAVFAPKD